MISVTFFLLSAIASLFLGSAAAQEAETCVVGHESCQDPLTHNRYPSCIDENLSCPKWAAEGQCDSETYEKYMKIACRKSCPNVCNHRDLDLGEIQIVLGNTAKDNNTRFVVAEALEYLNTVVHADPKYEPTRELCKIKHPNCAYWASLGECDNNPRYMRTSCSPVCKTCDMHDTNLRCPWDPKTEPALSPGDLDKMFEKITTDPAFSVYSPQILSQPKDDGPWIILLDDFVSEEECNHLITLGEDKGYFRSEGGDGIGEGGNYKSKVSEHRTSYQTWCIDDCHTDPVTKTVNERIEQLTGISQQNFEYLQLLKYEEGQYYKIHNDQILHHVNRPMGPRVLTAYFYLSDVEEGGGTAFPDLDLAVTPKRGRAILWPSVLNDEPFKIDERTDHEALPVLKGQKYGCNAWLHQGDFKTAMDNDCQI